MNPTSASALTQVAAMTRRRAITATAATATVAAGATWLAGCGAPAAGPPAPAAQQITLIHWGGLPTTHPSGAAHYGTLEEHATELRDTLGVTVQTDIADTEKILVASAGGTPPNTAWIGYGDSARIFVIGATADPDEALKKERDWAAQRKDIFPNMLESSVWGGKLTAVPVETNNRGIYFDKAVLAKAGVAPPTANWTRDEFVEKIVKATAPPDRWGFAITPGHLDWSIFYGAAGGQLFNKEQTKFTIDNEAGRDTLRWLYDLIYKQRAIPDPPAGEVMNKGEGKVAFDITGNFRLPVLRSRGVDVGSAPIPTHKTKFTVGQGWNLGIFKHKDAAVQSASARLVMWMNTPAFQVPYLIKSDNVPVSKAALAHKDFQAYLAKDPVVKVFSDQAPNVYRVPAMPSGFKAMDQITVSVKKALLNEQGINDAVAEAQRQAQLVLDEDLRQTSR